MAGQRTRARRGRTAKAVRWLLVCLVCVFGVLALVATAFRAPGIEGVRRAALSPERPDAERGEQERALTQQGERSRASALRQSGNPPGPGASGTLRDSREDRAERHGAVHSWNAQTYLVTRRFSEGSVVRGDSELYVWARPPMARAELMVFLN